MFASNAMVSKGDGDEEERREGEIYIYIYTEREKEKRKRRGENGAEEKTKRRGTKEQQPGGTCAMCLRTKRKGKGRDHGPRKAKREERRLNLTGVKLTLVGSPCIQYGDFLIESG